MSASSSIRAGAAYVEIVARDEKLHAGLKAAQARLQLFGKQVREMGLKLLSVAAVAATPLVASTKAFGDFEQSLADLKAVANPTGEELDLVRRKALQLSRETATAPNAVVDAFTELLKTGMPLENVLGGAAKAALEFARVGQLEVPEAATTMADAINVFAREGLSATQVVDILSKAADASSIGLEQMTQSFAQSSAAFGLTNQRLSDLAIAIGIMGNAGIKGSDAGTSLRTMMLRLTGAVGESQEVLDEFGVKTRDATGSMRPLRAIIGELQQKLGGLDKVSRDQALYRLFGADAIRSGSILMEQGVEGWDRFTAKVEGSLSVSRKAEIMNDTLWGSFRRLWGALERIGIAIGAAIAKPLSAVAGAITRYAGFVEIILKKNQWIAQTFFGVVTAVGAAGAALVSLGVASKLIGFALGGVSTILKVIGTAAAVIGPTLATAFTALTSPIGIALLAITGLAAAFFAFTETGQQALAWLGEKFAELADRMMTALQGIGDALAAGDLALASKVLWLTLQQEWVRGISFLESMWIEFKSAFLKTWSEAVTGLALMLSDAWAGLQSMWFDLITALSTGWNQFVALVTYTWNNIVALLEKGGTLLKSFFDDTINVEAEFAKIDEASLAGSREAFKQANEKIAAGQQSRDAAKLQVRKDQSDRNTALGEDLLREQSGLEKSRQAQLAAAEAPIAAAREAWQKAIAEAAQKRAQVNAEENPSVAEPDWAQRFRNLAQEAPQATEAAAKRTIDVQGTFNALGAVRGLGAGDAADRTAKATEAMDKKLGKLLGEVQQGGLVFA